MHSNKQNLPKILESKFKISEIFHGADFENINFQKRLIKLYHKIKCMFYANLREHKKYSNIFLKFRIIEKILKI